MKDRQAGGWGIRLLMPVLFALLIFAWFPVKASAAGTISVVSDSDGDGMPDHAFSCQDNPLYMVKDEDKRSQDGLYGLSGLNSMNGLDYGSALQLTDAQSLVSEDVLQSLSRLVSAGSTAPVRYGSRIYTNYTSAGNAIRAYMVDREDSFTIIYQSKNNYAKSSSAFNKFTTKLMQEVMKHTGDPQEGDSLRWNYHTWNIDGKARFLDTDGDGRTDQYRLTLTFALSYYTTRDQEEAYTNAADKIVSKLKLDSLSDYAAIKAVYNYIAENVAYDYDHLYKDSYKLKYTGYAALVKKKAVCQGYTQLFYRLMLMRGIDCRMIASLPKENHSWNIVKLGDVYYNLDCTWEAEYDDYPEYEWFLMCPGSFVISEDMIHDPDTEYSSAEFLAAYPMASEDYVQVWKDSAGKEVTVNKLKVTNTATNTLKASWAGVEGASGYDVYYKVSGGEWKTLKSVTGTFASLTSAVEGKKYFFTVKAEMPSSSGNGMVMTGAADPVFNVRLRCMSIDSIDQTEDGILLTWQPAVGCTGYKIYRKAKGESYSLLAMVKGASVSSFLDSSQLVMDSSGQTFYYAVKAYKGSCASAYVSSIITIE